MDVKGLTSGVSAIDMSGLSTYVLTVEGGIKRIRGTDVRDVVGMESGYVAIAGGCGLTVAGGVKCKAWGPQGALPPAEDLAGLTSGVATVSKGYAGHFCAVTVEGGVKCRGNNAGGQLGDGTNVYDPRVPKLVDVSRLTSGIASVSVGGGATCAVTTGGSLKCWGVGAFGNGEIRTNSNVPVDVPELGSDIASVSLGNFYGCLLSTEGKIKCWGHNSKGQLGDGTAGNARGTAVDVIGFGAVPTPKVQAVAVTVGNGHTCALTSEGGVKCWGDNRNGQVGKEEVGYPITPTPADVVGLTSGVKNVSTRGKHTCAVTAAGGVKCWGQMKNGKLGNGSKKGGFNVNPVDVAGLSSGVVEVSAGEEHTCAVTAASSIKCWGANGIFGLLGDAKASGALSAVPVDTNRARGKTVAVSAGGSHSCALKTDGDIACWGDNTTGQLGRGIENPEGATSGVLEVAVGGSGQFYNSFTCTLNTSGGVKCWGVNDIGQLGDFTTSDRAEPDYVYLLEEGVTAISAGESHTCALTTSGGIKCWGDNAAGQLGDGKASGKFSNKPVDVLGLSSGVSTVSAGVNHTCAVLESGGIKCWGSNQFGQLGEGTTKNYSTPVDVVGFGN